MLSLRTVRRLCAAIAATFIAANLSRSLASSAAPSSSIPDNFPTISAAAKALSKSRSPNRQPPPPPPPPPPDPIPTTPTSPALVKIKAERDPEKLFELFNSNSRNTVVVENRFAFEDAVSRLAGARRHDLVFRLLEQQKYLPQGRREGFLVRIITLYGRAGMPDHALKTFDEMPATGCRRRTVKSFNATLKVLSQARMFDDVHLLFTEGPAKYGIELDEISYNTVIKVMCEMGRLDSTYLVMMEMEKAGCKPDVVTYTTLMSLRTRPGSLRLAMDCGI